VRARERSSLTVTKTILKLRLIDWQSCCLLSAACCSLLVRALSLFFVVTLDVVTCNLTARQCFQSAYYNKSEANSEPVFVAIRIDSLSRSLARSCESCVRVFVCSYIRVFIFPVFAHLLAHSASFTPRWSPRLLGLDMTLLLGAVMRLTTVSLSASASSSSLTLLLSLQEWGVARLDYG